METKKENWNFDRIMRISLKFSILITLLLLIVEILYRGINIVCLGFFGVGSLLFGVGTIFGNLLLSFAKFFRENKISNFRFVFCVFLGIGSFFALLIKINPGDSKLDSYGLFFTLISVLFLSSLLFQVFSNPLKTKFAAKMIFYALFFVYIGMIPVIFFFELFIKQTLFEAEFMPKSVLEYAVIFFVSPLLLGIVCSLTLAWFLAYVPRGIYKFVIYLKRISFFQKSVLQISRFFKWLWKKILVPFSGWMIK
jgi:hypothetical protein